MKINEIYIPLLLQKKIAHSFANDVSPTVLNSRSFFDSHSFNDGHSFFSEGGHSGAQIICSATTSQNSFVTCISDDDKINVTKWRSYFSFFQGIKAANIRHI
jgi:hypothetical protein